MTLDAQLKRNRLQRFDPRAWIGYLVGCESTNIFRIWVPRLNRVIQTRDVKFNEDEVFDGNIESEAVKENIRNMSLKRLAELLKEMELPMPNENNNPNPQSNESEMIRAQEVLQKLEESIYPTPPESPPAMLAGSD
jgi:hypothetical protein